MSLDGIAVDDLCRAVRLHDVAPFVLHGLEARPDAPREWMRALRPEADRVALVTLRHSAEFPMLAERLGSVTDRWVAFKGPVLASTYPSGSPQRGHTDLDVLVDPAALAGVLGTLEEWGAQAVGDPWAELLRTQRAQITLRLPGGSILDLHWHPFNNPGVRSRFAVTTEQWLDRRQPLTVFGVSACTFDPVDTMLHAACHATLAGGFRLKWIKDVDVLARAPVDWTELAERAQRTRLGLPTAVMLLRSGQVLGTPLPATTMRRLGARTPWARALGLVGAAAPPQRATRPLATGNVAFSATRDTGFASARQFLRALRFAVIGPLLTNAQHPWRGGQGRPRNTSIWSLSADPAGRSALLHWVEHEFT